MSVGNVIFERLSNDPTVGPLVRNADGKYRITPWITGQGLPFPRITYQVITKGRVFSHNGASGLETPMVQIDVWSLDPDELEALATAVGKPYQQAGVVIDGPLDCFVGQAAGRTVQAVLKEDEREDMTDPVSGDEQPIGRRSFDFTFWLESED